MSVVPSIIVLVITALLVFRRELTTRPAAPASKVTPGAKRRSLRQSETSSASLMASRNTLAEIIHPRRFAMRQASYASFTDERRIADFDP
jgi:hypothetical protein